MVDENKPVVDEIKKTDANAERRHQESQESEKKTEGALKEVTKSIQVFNKEETKENKRLVKDGKEATKELKRIEKEIEELVGKAADHEDIEKLLQQAGHASKIEERNDAIKRKEDGEAANKSLTENKEQTKKIKEQTGISAKQLQKAQQLDAEIAEQNKAQKELKKTLESLGLRAEDNAKFQEGQKKIARAERNKAKVLGSKDAEEKADKKIRDARSNTLLGKIANKMTDIAKGTKEKVKGGIMGMLKGVAFGGFVLAILAFINSPYFDKTMKVLKDFIVPGLAFLYDNILAPIGRFFGMIIDFVDEKGKEYFGIEGLGSKIASTLAALVGLFTVGMFFAPFITMGLLKGGKWIFLAPLKLAFKGIALAFKKLTGGVKATEKMAQGAAKGATAATGAAAKGATAVTGAAAKGATVAATGAAKSLAQPVKPGLNMPGQPAARGKLSSVTGAVKDKFAHMKQFPRLLKVAKAIPILGSVLTAGQAVMILTSDKSVNEKKKALGGLVGGTLGAAGLGMVGAAMGSVIPGPGTIIGGIIGSLLGFFSGEYIGTKLMSFLLDGKIEKEKTPQTAGGGGGRGRRSSRKPPPVDYNPEHTSPEMAAAGVYVGDQARKATPQDYIKLTNMYGKKGAEEHLNKMMLDHQSQALNRMSAKQDHRADYDASMARKAEQMIPTRGVRGGAAPPVLSASNNVNAPSTTNVTQNSTSMVNKDRVIDNLNYVY